MPQIYLTKFCVHRKNIDIEINRKFYKNIKHETVSRNNEISRSKKCLNETTISPTKIA